MQCSYFENVLAAKGRTKIQPNSFLNETWMFIVTLCRGSM